MNLQEIQAHPLVSKARKGLAVVGVILVAYLIYRSRTALIEAITQSPTVFMFGLLVGCVSLLIQAAGFRTFPKIGALGRVTVSDIWCSAIIFNHIFPLAGGLGYRFVAFKLKGVELRDTGRATAWFLGTSATTSIAALAVISIYTQVDGYLGIVVALALLTVVPLAARRFMPEQTNFAFAMIAYQLVQVFAMGLVVLVSAILVDLDLSLAQAAALGCVMRLGSLVSLTPAGLGIQEAIIIGVLTSYGVSSQDGSSTAVMVRILYLVSAVIIALGSRVLLLGDQGAGSKAGLGSGA